MTSTQPCKPIGDCEPPKTTSIRRHLLRYACMGHQHCLCISFCVIGSTTAFDHVHKFSDANVEMRKRQSFNQVRMRITVSHAFDTNATRLSITLSCTVSRPPSVERQPQNPLVCTICRHRRISSTCRPQMWDNETARTQLQKLTNLRNRSIIHGSSSRARFSDEIETITKP